MSRKVIVIRPIKKNEELKAQLEKLAAKKEWSLNKYLNVILSQHAKKALK